MPKITLVNTQPRLFGTCIGVSIPPGTHEFDLPEAKLQELLADEQFQAWQQLGWMKRKVSVVGTPPAPEPTPEPAPEPAPAPVSSDPRDALKELTLVEAEKVIVACEDPELLAEWYDADSRKGIKAMVESRLEDLDALGD